MQKKKILFMIISILGIVSLATGTSFALLNNKAYSDEQIVKTGNVKVILTEQDDNFTQDIKEYVKDKNYSYYSFSVKNKGTIKSTYKISLDNVKNTLDYKYLKISVEKNDIMYDPKPINEDLSIINENIEVGKTDNYKIRIWLNTEGLTQEEKESLIGKSASFKLKLDAAQYVFDLNAAPTNELCFKTSNNIIEDYYEYENNNDKNPKCPKEVVIPEKINNITIDSIADYSFGSKNITRVRFSDNIINIGAFSFYQNNLKYVNIPKNVKSIYDFAFGENDIKSVTILGKKEFTDFTHIGANIFGDNFANENIKFDN